ncbi:hypothetical protein RJ639_042817, partial [Escallonia herrerae]
NCTVYSTGQKMSRYLFLCFFLFQLVYSELPSNQITTMNTLYEVLRNYTASGNAWNRDPNPCLWRGVSCSSGDSTITAISLSWLSPSASDFLPILCQIDTLQSIDVSAIYLSSIPDGFLTGCGGITGLKLLNFSRNRLVGSLPNFDGFAVLEYLDLSRNLFTGNIGLQLNGLVSLKGLNLGFNHFDGSVPTSLGKLMLLEQLVLSANNFKGKIPEEIGNCKNLTLIDLSVNQLSGSVPDIFGDLSKLELLILSSNTLSGGIPVFLLNITTLLRFAANQNNFTGTIPPGISRYLENLDLSYNMLNGSIPVDLLTPPNLQFVDLSNNLLEGSVPANISSSLVRLRLGGNLLNGTIPSSSLGILQNLTYLELESNMLTGTIPPELGSCNSLALLNLAENRLTGSLPVQLSNLGNIQVIKLQHNNLVGEIPDQFSQMTLLQTLNISWNYLNGSIPHSVSSLDLVHLDLHGNNLSGSIPDSIGSLYSLLELQLGSNQLTGAITLLPRSLQIALNLSNNNFEGPIPDSLSRLTGLEVLDLSNNRFSGEIPTFLSTMESLTLLVLSNNQLSGVIPNFKSRVTLVVTGNKNLINATTTNSNPSPSEKNKKVAVWVVVAAAAAGVVAVGIIAVIAMSISRRFYRISDEHPGLMVEDDLSQPKVIERKLLTANPIHSSNIDFAKAMEVVTHPSSIVLKTRFSTYYEVIMPSGKSYYVKKLNWSNKIFQLHSHEKFGEELEVLGKLSNSNVMIPLAYVLSVGSAYLFYELAEKGTLHDVLHDNLGNDLDWASRYSIAVGIAQGLAFLHGYTSGPILLLDLSSKSILLKSFKEPQVGDIELCKVIDPSKNTGSLSTIAGSVGYIPPEYAYTMRVTMAGNVYSFGILLLELLTGKPAVSNGTELARWVLSKPAQQDKWDHILDFRVAKKSSLAARSQMASILRIALACVSISPEARPNMKSVLRMLINAR